MGRFLMSVQNTGRRKCIYINLAQALWFIEPESNVIMFTCTVKSSYGCSSIRPFNWTTVLVLVHKSQLTISSLSVMVVSNLYSWLLLDLLSVSKTGCKQVSKQLAESKSNTENADNFKAPYTSYLLFTCGINLMCASPYAYRILVYFLAFFYKFMLFEMWVKDRREEYQSCTDCLGQSRSGGYTCRSISTPNSIVWVCKTNFEKFCFIQFIQYNTIDFLWRPVLSADYQSILDGFSDL